MLQSTAVAAALPHSLTHLAGHLRDATESGHVAFGQWVSGDQLVVMHWPQLATPRCLALRGNQIPDSWRAVSQAAGTVTLNDPHHWLTWSEDGLDVRVSRSLMAPVRNHRRTHGILSLASRSRPYLHADLKLLEACALVMSELLTEWDSNRYAAEQLVIREAEIQQLRDQLRMADERCRSAEASIEELVERMESLRGIETQARTYRAILNAIPDVVYLKGESGYQFINARFESLFGVKNEAIQGLTDAEVFSGYPLLAEQFQKNDEMVRRTGQTLRIEEVAPHADGPHRYATVKFPVADETGQIHAVAGISTDITASDDRKRLLLEMMQAEQLQRHLYPTSAPVIDGFELFGATFPAAEVCGDYFDFISLADGSVVAALGDVCGHDLPAAMWMVATRSYLRGLLRHPASLGEIVETLDDLVSMDIDVSKFVSLFLVHICPRNRLITYSAAGHDGVIVRTTGEEEILHSEDLLLGIEPKHRNERSVPLESGDLLVLWTDGLHEAINPARIAYGRKAFLASVSENRFRPLPEIFHEAYQAVIQFHGGPRLGDDATMVLIRAR